MGRRAAVFIALMIFVLTGGAGGAMWVVYRAATRSVEEVLTQRIETVGANAALLLAWAPDRSAALRALMEASSLDGAYVVDAELRVLADAGGTVGRRANLLRLDPDRASAALAGRTSTGWAFDLDGVRFFGGCFPLDRAPAATALVLEAGAAFTAPSRALRATALSAAALGAAVALVALLVLALAARAAKNERLAFGRIERAAVASQLAAMVAHEVRNPLGIIRGGAELLRERSAAPCDQEMLDDILEEVGRLNRLTEEFLVLGRELPLRLERVDLGRLSREVCEGARLRAGERAPMFEVRASGDVLADEDRLRQALLNLVLNAVDACGGEGTVRVFSDAVDRTGTKIVVEDSGPGVPAELRPRLFEAFATGKTQGTGLGLAVSRKIVEQHGGSLEHVPSARGARFEVWLPAQGRR